jgi:hypothetical protein
VGRGRWTPRSPWDIYTFIILSKSKGDIEGAKGQKLNREHTSRGHSSTCTSLQSLCPTFITLRRLASYSGQPVVGWNLGKISNSYKYSKQICNSVHLKSWNQETAYVGPKWPTDHLAKFQNSLSWTKVANCVSLATVVEFQNSLGWTKVANWWSVFPFMAANDCVGSPMHGGRGDERREGPGASGMTMILTAAGVWGSSHTCSLVLAWWKPMSRWFLRLLLPPFTSSTPCNGDPTQSLATMTQRKTLRPLRSNSIGISNSASWMQISVGHFGST